jgi:hypothetical protein
MAPAMARADNSSFLTQANARRHQAALLAAHHAIEQLQRQGRAVSFSTVAQSAGFSELKAIIDIDHLMAVFRTHGERL